MSDPSGSVGSTGSTGSVGSTGNVPQVPTDGMGRPLRPAGVTVIGIVDLVGAGFAALSGMLMLVGAIAIVAGAGEAAPAPGEPGAGLIAVLGTVFLLLAGLYGAAGIGMLRTAPWGRTAQIVASCVGLLFFCLGTIVNACILAYVLQPSVRIAMSGRRVDEMREDERRALSAGVGGGAGTAVIVLVVAGVLVLAGIFVTGILAAIAIPNFVTAVERGKQKRTMADLRDVASALESYATDVNAYPDASTISELARKLEPTYAKILAENDAWGRPFDVATSAEGYVLRSRGKDGEPDEDDPWDAGLSPGPTTDFDADIVFSNGSFVRWPEAASP